MHVNVHLSLSFLGMIVGMIICNIYTEFHKVENNYVKTIKIVVDEIIALTELEYYIFKGHMMLMVGNAQLETDNFQLNPTFTTLLSIYLTSKFITLSISLLINPKIHDITNSPHNQSIYWVQNSRCCHLIFLSKSSPLLPFCTKTAFYEYNWLGCHTEIG